MKYTREIILSLVLIVLLALMQYPSGMSTTAQMVVLGIFLVVFVAFIFFLFREMPRDEREELERSAISRFSYLVTASVLVLGLTWTELHHAHNFWLLAALVATVGSKIIGSIYFKLRE